MDSIEEAGRREAGPSCQGDPRSAERQAAPRSTFASYFCAQTLVWFASGPTCGTTAEAAPTATMPSGSSFCV